ncbi:hypothetical protein [Nocardia otitidiscaviarum]|uniref:hypothetical protein n=1 Tax=Nocardia otitidiscaviarum TaxID=1823 RepID=UPI001894E3FF|nr:hypothetical protein [Nocardia otitidiscaviarum]MBF6183329.1 hypothetical protein [Nocardia otitidiscaviarum]
MGAEEAAPCRHAGAPPQVIVESVSKLIQDLGVESELLGRYGLTVGEYRAALPAAIEGLRGSMSASVADRKEFLAGVFRRMLEAGIIDGLESPKYGKDTVYRLTVNGYGDIAVIQKGCPDGKHSSIAWSSPSWARETYLWWLCDSMRYEPGQHIDKGVKRLRKRFFDELPDTISGVIFHNHLCGSGQRRCPKIIDGPRVIEAPPPCLYVMPDRQADVSQWNWDGRQERFFPGLLLGAFGVVREQVPYFTGHIGFQRRGASLRTTITSRFGPGRATTFRS